MIKEENGGGMPTRSAPTHAFQLDSIINFTCLSHWTTNTSTKQTGPAPAPSMDELDNPRAMKRMVKVVSSLLEGLAESNEQNDERNTRRGIVSVFHGLTRPTISVQGYLERIFKYANCSPSCLIVAYVYLDRFADRQPSLPISTFNVHRLIIASIVVSIKFMDDLYYNNAYYAKVGGISTAEMNILEIDYLFALGFDLSVRPDTFQSYYNNLVGQMTLLECPVGLEASLTVPRWSQLQEGDGDL